MRTLEERLLFICTRQDFDFVYEQAATAICLQDEIDWDMVYTIAVAHHVAPLIYVNLQQCIRNRGPIVPKDIVHRFKTVSAQSAVREETRLSSLLDSLETFAEQHVDVMLIKSKALDILVYDRPWYTTPDDIDLILRPRDDGFSAEQRQFIAGLEALGIECDAVSHHDLDMNGILPVDFDRIWRDSYETQVHGYTVSLMSQEDMLLSLCINSCRKRYLRLKAMCDIAETVWKREIDWSIFLDKARDYRISDIVYTALWVTNQCLTSRVPADIFGHLGVNPVRVRLIHQIVEHVSLESVSDLRSGSGAMIFGRQLSSSAGLRYATMRWDQILRHFRFVSRTPRATYEFWDGT